MYFYWSKILLIHRFYAMYIYKRLELAFNNISKILEYTLSREIGLKLFIVVLLPDLKIGITLKILKAFKNLPVLLHSGLLYATWNEYTST